MVFLTVLKCVKYEECDRMNEFWHWNHWGQVLRIFFHMTLLRFMHVRFWFLWFSRYIITHTNTWFCFKLLQNKWLCNYPLHISTNSNHNSYLTYLNIKLSHVWSYPCTNLLNCWPPYMSDRSFVSYPKFLSFNPSFAGREDTETRWILGSYDFLDDHAVWFRYPYFAILSSIFFTSSHTWSTFWIFSLFPQPFWVPKSVP